MTDPTSATANRPGLIYVTGIPGAGKSAVRHELIRRGYRAYDTDEDDISPASETTSTPAGEGTRSRRYARLSRERVEGLAQAARTETVFLCGTKANDNEVWDLFSQVIYLAIDEGTLRERLATRTTNDFGKDPEELRQILGWHETSEESYRSFGAVVVDATRPLPTVVDDLLASLR